MYTKFVWFFKGKKPKKLYFAFKKSSEFLSHK